MLAQRYPNAYDGIAAGAPALYWPELFAGLQWPQQVMNVLGSYPYGCELDEIAAAAISACDTLDGVVDGIVTEVDACLDKFDPFTLVNKTIDCPQAQAPIRITRAAALLTQAVWRGPRTADDRRLWYGLNPGVDLTGNNPIYNTAGPGVAYTNCTTGTCVGVPDSPWFQLFIAKDAEFDMGNLTNAEFAAMAHAGRQQYGSILATDDADLSWFRDAGGKMISFHGLVSAFIAYTGRVCRADSGANSRHIGRPDHPAEGHGALLPGRKRRHGVGRRQLLPSLRGARPRALLWRPRRLPDEPVRAAPGLGGERNRVGVFAL